MMSTKTLDDFEKLVQRIAELMCRYVEARPDCASWDGATLDVRFDGTGGSWIDKFRVAIPGTGTVSMKMGTDIPTLLISLNSLRQEVFPETWFGIKIKVDRVRKVDVVYDYDPKCADDPRFYDD